jgi:anti-sigma factor RsiW
MNEEETRRCPLRSEEHASLLLDYCSRKLDEDRRRTLERHMAMCPECARFRDGQAALWQALDAWESSPVTRGFDFELEHRIVKAERDPLWMRAGAWFAEVSWAPAVPALAAAALWIFLFQPVPPPEAVQPPSALEPDQVERVLEDLDMLRQLPL